MFRIKQEPRELFYKDEGGKSNHLVCIYELSKKGSNIPAAENISHRLYLEESSHPLDSKEVLNIISTDLNPSTIIVRFRIEKVSRRYDGSKFRLGMTVKTGDDEETFFSGCIMVLSKRKASQSSNKSAQGSSSTTGSNTPSAKRQKVSNRLLEEILHRLKKAEKTIERQAERINLLENLASCDDSMSLSLRDVKSNQFDDWKFETPELLPTSLSLLQERTILSPKGWTRSLSRGFSGELDPKQKLKNEKLDTKSNRLSLKVPSPLSL